MKNIRISASVAHTIITLLSLATATPTRIIWDVAMDGGVLMGTGAKLFYRGRWILGGYAADGNDVDVKNIIRILTDEIAVLCKSGQLEIY